MGCKARTPLDWTHAWAMLGEWAGTVAFPIPAHGVEWPRHGHGIYLRPNFIHRTPPFLTWARPIFEQGALSPMSVFPSNFPILCLPGDKLFQSKDLDDAYCLPPIMHAFQGNKVRIGKKLQKSQKQGPYPLAVFFFLGYGRSRSKARSLHEKKLLLRKLLHGHRWSHAAGQIITTKTQTTNQKTQARRRSPSQICVSPSKGQQSKQRTGQEPNKNNHERFAQDTVVTTHCVATDSKTCSKRISCHPVK